MNRLLKSRYKAYLKKAAKVNYLLKKGYMIFDSYGDRVNEPFKLDREDKKLYREHKCGDFKSATVYFAVKGDWRNDITVKEINEKFSKWKAVNPCNIESL
jgi:hypothetical protein